MEKKTIGSFIAALRRANGLTQRQLADKLCVSDKAVSRWERDEALPDLSLIPELADIFGVTADEILRGERRNPEAIASPTSDKGEKLRKRLLAKKKTTYKILSIVSIGISVIGLLFAMLINFCGYMAMTGFFTGAACFTVAVILQVSAIFIYHSDIDEEMLTQADRIARNEHTFQLACRSLGVTFMLFALCLPLACFGNDSLFGKDWLVYGIISLFGGILICVLAVNIVGVLLTKRGLVFNSPHSIALLRFRLRFVGIGALVLAVLFGVQVLGGMYLQDAINRPIRFDNWNDLKVFMETSTARPQYKTYRYEYDWALVLFDCVPEPIEDPNDKTPVELDYIRDPDGNILCEFYPRNGNIGTIDINIDDPDNPKITVYTRSKMWRAAVVSDYILTAYYAVYPLAVIILYFIYRKKKKSV